MEYASDAYKEAMQENVRGKSYVWASLDLVNQYAQDTAYISSSFSGSETNLYNDAEPDGGATSTESDGSMTFTFGEYTTLLLGGVMFTLGNDPLPTSVTITNGTTSKTVTVSSAKVMLENDFSNCHYLKITPNSGDINIKKIQFGFTIDFDHDLIMETRRRNIVKHLNDELPLKEFSFTIHNYDRHWNKDNPFGYSRFLQEKQQVRFKYGREIGENNIYEINGGVVYLKDWTSDDYKATFSSVGLLDYEQDDYDKGRFYPDGITLYQLAEFVLQDAGIVKYELDAVLRTFTVTNPLPKDTHKACLQMIAHAGRCVLYEDRNGAVCLKSVDRPEILKTATLHDETSFSDGNDVITTTTVANYGSTEPNYTKADGLHYFYPESQSSSYVIDKSTNLLPNPYYDGASKNENGVIWTVNNDRSITITGKLDRDYLDDGDLESEEFEVAEYYSPVPITPGRYVFGVEQEIEDPSDDEQGTYPVMYGVFILHKNGVERGVYYSYDSYSSRTFDITENMDYSFAVIVKGLKPQTINRRAYPQLYKFVEVYDEPTNTLPVGFVSQEFAKSDGTFDSTPQIDINFSSPCKLSEVVLNCAVAPKDLQIKTYLENVQKASESITDNTSAQIIQTFNNMRCDKVTITFSKTTAYQRIHVNTVELGAAIDYEITYTDMTSTPTATSLEKLSKMDFQIYSYSNPADIQGSAGIGGVSVSYSELPSGGQAIDITSSSDTIAYFKVKAGINDIELSGNVIASSAEYADEIEGGTVVIVESSAYYARVNASRDGEIIIKGTEMVQNIYSYQIPVNEVGNPVKVDNPLISTKEHADRLKDWFLDYYDDDIEYTLQYRGDPILDADDTVFLENQFVYDNLIRIQSEEISTSGGMNTSNQIVARRISYGNAKPDPLVAQDFALNTTSISGLFIGDTAIITVPTWVPITARDRHVTFASEDTSVVTVSQSGVVTAVGDGTTYVTVTSDNGIVKRCAIEVVDSQAVRDFTLSESSLSLDVGDTETLTVVAWVPEDARDKTITWSSTNTAVATVDSTGLVTAVAKGNVSIKARAHSGVEKTCAVAVADPLELRDFTLSDSSLTLYVNDTHTITVTEWVPANARDKSLTWASSNTSVATVDQNGVVTAVGEGSVTISATSSNNIVKTCSTAVSYDPSVVRDFTLSPTTAQIMPNETVQLQVSDWVPSTATRKTVTYQSSNTNIATVDANGLITGVADGNVTITATCPDGISKTCALVVLSYVPVTDFVLPYNNLVITSEYVDITPISWTPSNATNKRITLSTADSRKVYILNNRIKQGGYGTQSVGSTTVTATCPDGISKTCITTGYYETEMWKPPFYDGDKTENGVTFTVNFRSIDFNGTANGDAVYRIKYNSTLRAGKYHLFYLALEDFQHYYIEVTGKVGNNTFRILSTDSYDDRIFDLQSDATEVCVNLIAKDGFTFNSCSRDLYTYGLMMLTT